jgi:hypothetical protein
MLFCLLNLVFPLLAKDDPLFFPSNPLTHQVVQSDTICLPPENFGIVNITQHSSRFVWTDVAAGTQYRIRMFQSTSLLTDTIIANSFQYNIANILPETAYKIQLATVCGNQQSAFTDWIEWNTLPLPLCQTPTGLQLTSITDSSTRLDWMPTPGTTGYNLFFKQTNAFDWDSIGCNQAGITLTNLSPSTGYQCKVSARCGTGISERSAMLLIRTLAPSSCKAPKTPILIGLTQTTATWHWQKTLHVSGYQVMDRIPEDSGWRIWRTTDTLMNIPIRVQGKPIELMLRSICATNASEFTSITRTNTLPVKDSSDVHEPNNNSASAPLIFPPVNLKGNLLLEDDQDWFRIEVPSDETKMRFAISSAPDNLELTIWNEAMEALPLNQISSQFGSVTWEGVFQSGMHFIRIKRNQTQKIIDLIESDAGDSTTNQSNKFHVRMMPTEQQHLDAPSDTLIWHVQHRCNTPLLLHNWQVQNDATIGIEQIGLFEVMNNREPSAILYGPKHLIQPSESWVVKIVVGKSYLANNSSTSFSLWLDVSEIWPTSTYHLKILMPDNP